MVALQHLRQLRTPRAARIVHIAGHSTPTPYPSEGRYRLSATRSIIGAAQWTERMGYNARNDEIRDNVTRMRREWEAQRDALATIRRFNATLSAKGYVWFWPKIAAALTSKHHWLSYRLRQLRHRGRSRFANEATRSRKPLYELRYATCNARAAMGMDVHASLRWRGIRRFDKVKGAITSPKSERQKRLKSSASEPRRKVSLKSAPLVKSMILRLMFQMRPLEREGGLSFTRYGCP